MKYILEELDKEDKIVRFYEKDASLSNYTIDLDFIARHRVGGVELLVYSFLDANASIYWNDYDKAPTGRIFMEMDVFDFVKVTGCSAQEIRNALFILNEARLVRVTEIKYESGIAYAFHATC